MKLHAESMLDAHINLYETVLVGTLEMNLYPKYNAMSLYDPRWSEFSLFYITDHDINHDDLFCNIMEEPINLARDTESMTTPYYRLVYQLKLNKERTGCAIKLFGGNDSSAVIDGLNVIETSFNMSAIGTVCCLNFWSIYYEQKERGQST